LPETKRKLEIMNGITLTKKHSNPYEILGTGAFQELDIKLDNLIVDRDYVKI
jgi:hypothetical protein